MVVVNRFFEERVEQIFDLAELVETIFSSAGIEYRVVGGLAVYLYVEEVEPDAGRLTKDIDIAVRREDLERIATRSGSTCSFDPISQTSVDRCTSYTWTLHQQPPW